MVRLHIMTRYKLFREIFFDKKIFTFLNCAFLLRDCQILSVFQKVLLHIHFVSWAARIRNDFLWIRVRILLRVSDPYVSGSTILFPSNTAKGKEEEKFLFVVEVHTNYSNFTDVSASCIFSVAQTFTNFLCFGPFLHIFALRKSSQKS